MDNANEKKVVDISTLAYDLTAITDFIFQSKNKDKQTEIKEIYETNPDGAVKLVQKSMTETKVEESNGAASIRYGIVSSLMEKANSIMMDEYGEFDEAIEEGNGLEGLSAPVMSQLGDTFAINTLLREGMLVKMDLNELENR